MMRTIRCEECEVEVRARQRCTVDPLRTITDPTCVTCGGELEYLDDLESDGDMDDEDGRVIYDRARVRGD